MEYNCIMKISPVRNKLGMLYKDFKESTSKRFLIKEPSLGKISVLFANKSIEVNF